MLRKFLQILLLISSTFAFSDSQTFINLQGYLGKEELTKAKDSLESLSKGQNNTLLIEVNSTSGELNQVLDLAKKIYELKATQSVKIAVYINQNAIGPAAIFPFIADDLMTSLFVSWGDIPLGSEGLVPTNILRNQVRSLISEKSPNQGVLHVLADAMTDPSLQVVEDNGWKIVVSGKDNAHPAISAAGQTLVVNHNQLKQLGLVSNIISPEQFKERFGLTEHVAPNPQIEETENPLEVTSREFEQELKAHIQFNPNGQNLIGRIIIDDRDSGINQSTWLYVKKALDHYREIKPIFVILELNTPGGEVFAAQKISDALKELDTNDNIPVIAYINNWAISAGAMLAYSCRFIVTVKDGSMGAAEPVIAKETGQMESASEKVNSAIRADFASRASFFGRNPLIAQSMVDKDTILVMRHGKVTKLDNESQIRLTGPDPDTVITPKGKLLTLDAQQMKEFGVADAILLPEKVESVTDAEKEIGEWPASKSLIFQQSFFKEIPNAKIVAYVMDWKTRFFVLLASPVVSSILFLGMIVGAYIELNSPGVVLPGVIAGLCLFLIVLSSFSLEIANWLELILLLSGILLILTEIFVFPTVGILAVIGAVFFIIGFFGMMLPNIGAISFDYDAKVLNAAGEYFFERLAWLCGTLLIGMVIIFLLARYVTPSFKGFKRFVLEGGEQVGFSVAENPALMPQIGAKGEVFATLRPGGKVMINQTIYDAVSNGAYLEEGVKIVVVKLEGNTLIVDEEPA